MQPGMTNFKTYSPNVISNEFITLILRIIVNNNIVPT